MSQHTILANEIPIKQITAASLAVFVGIGLSRFAYNPLMPATILEGWFPPSHAIYFAVANLAGYLVGALISPWLSQRIAPYKLLRASMLSASVIFFCSTSPVSFAWFFTLRFLSGFIGSIAMVLAALTVLPHVHQRLQGIASGIIFAGVGLGIVASGALVPFLLTINLPSAWAHLGVIAFLATFISWFWWPEQPPEGASVAPQDTGPCPQSRSFIGTYTSYALVSAALVGHMIFLVDFVSRGLGESIDLGGRLLILFGIGAILGPIVSGTLVDRLGTTITTRLLFTICVPSIGILAMDSSLVGIAISSAITGCTVTAIPSLVLGRIKELTASPSARKRAWGTATACYAISQTTVSFFLAETLRYTNENYAVIFLICTALMAMALVVNLVNDRVSHQGETHCSP
ncbi:YbfB/YjiJ family MFS transporter [Halomonas sp. V046]|uniref:YbfB/YjiJ family MFS transporter n=1 Tax=Halomonas sp. V046 TaxID=3459611 RepID=UPI00404458F0